MSASRSQVKIKLTDLRDIGWRFWDPINISFLRDEHCDDEYDPYLMHVASMALSDLPRANAVAYLMDIAERHMEVSPDEGAAMKTVDAIWQLADTAKASQR